MLLITAPSLARAQTQITIETFRTNTLTNSWTFSGNPRPCLTVAGSTSAAPSCSTASPNYQDPSGAGWLRLTPAAGNAANQAVLNTPFPLASGFDLTFTYAMYGGTALNPPAAPADGISVFLFDPTATNAGTGGAFGGGLGFCGMAGGFLGIGLDAYGNWSNTSTGTSSNHYAAGECGNTGPGFQQSNISVRTGANAQTPWNFLAGTGQISPNVLRTDANWSYPTGGICTAGGSCVRNGQRIHISFYPDTTCGTNQYRILVESLSDGTTPANLCIGTTDLGTLPATVELGFGAGTGGANQYQEIRGLTIGPVADLSITQTDGQTAYAPGQMHTYTIVVTNNGPAPGDGATFADPVVAGLNVSAVTCSTASSGAACPANPTVTAMQGTGIAIPALPANSSMTFTLTATVAAGTTGDLSNLASVTPAGVSNSGVSCVAAGSVYTATTGTCAATDTDTPAPASDTTDASPVSIPSLSRWALALLVLALTGGVMVVMRRHSARR